MFEPGEIFGCGGLVGTFFSDSFGISKGSLDDFGAFNISLVNDLPLFIDPFLLFNSQKEEYQELHAAMIRYLVFLRDSAAAGPVNDGLLRGWYCFPEVKQNWLGFSASGNSGSGLGMDFARALHANLHLLFQDFGQEQITAGSHLEKVCLISDGVGRDNISDFTTNLILDYLCRYTERFAREHLRREDVREVAVPKAGFNYETQTWMRGQYTLPWANDDYVVLTPKDMLTRDDTWINRHDLIDRFEQIPLAIPDEQLRAQVNNYFRTTLSRVERRQPNRNERADAARRTVIEFPKIIDYYIKLKEQTGDEAADVSSERVLATEHVYVEQVEDLQTKLVSDSLFYTIAGNTYEEAHERLAYLKDVIENKGGHRFFWHNGTPIEREKDLHVLYRLVWFGTPSSVTAEANDGRGPVDFKISRGARDQSLVEMKLAKNTQLKRNLQNQVPIYQAASDAEHAIKAIIFFTASEEERVAEILNDLGISGHPDIVLIDARNDNKPSGSRA